MTLSAETLPAIEEEASESSILAWGLGRMGIGCVVKVGGERSVSSCGEGMTADFAIHLERTAPVEWVVRALAELVGRKGALGVVMTMRRARAGGYSEHLELDGESRVVGVRRGFRRGEQQVGRKCLLGVAWKISAGDEAGEKCWRTARGVMRGGRVRWQEFSAGEMAGYFIGPRNRERRVYGFFKRGFDVGFSLMALLVTLPVCMAVAVIVKCYDRGPVFFVHRREGVRGRAFGCLKFRTMVRDAEAKQRELRKVNQVDGPQFKLAVDPRVTPIGNFLRRTNIDELPQFLNVLMGSMSVVGPRPSPFEENQLCPAWREARLSVKPGITGLWQVSRSRERGAADFQEWILYDTQYVERRGFWLDVKIVLLTIKELFGKGQ